MEIDVYKVVKKLVGNINPIGETNTDNERFENLKMLCELVEKLVIDIDEVSYLNKNAHQFSIKRASDYANGFINKIGIE